MCGGVTQEHLVVDMPGRTCEEQKAHQAAASCRFCGNELEDKPPDKGKRKRKRGRGALTAAGTGGGLSFACMEDWVVVSHM